MAAFVQIIEYQTSRPEEVAALGEEFRKEREASGEPVGQSRLLVTQDRGRPGYYLTIVEFGSYEDAMKNSERADTSAFAAKMSELCDGPPNFYNLDVLDSRETSA